MLRATASPPRTSSVLRAFLVTEQADLDRLGERTRGVFTRLVDTNLTEAERSMLLEAVGGRGQRACLSKLPRRPRPANATFFRDTP
jgi:hypothetical protein